jgi:hypothetical protein
MCAQIFLALSVQHFFLLGMGQEPSGMRGFKGQGRRERVTFLRLMAYFGEKEF